MINIFMVLKQLELTQLLAQTRVLKKESLPLRKGEENLMTRNLENP